MTPDINTQEGWKKAGNSKYMDKYKNLHSSFLIKFFKEEKIVESICTVGFTRYIYIYICKIHNNNNIKKGEVKGDILEPSL